MFITFEGIEGSGKSTHCEWTAKYLTENGLDVVLLREPGGTKIGELIRNILLDKDNVEMTVDCELLLYNAARVQLVSEIIKPALDSGKVVVCDRFFDSTVAYQCYGGQLDFQKVQALNTIASMRISPDFTVLLDSDVQRGLLRAGRGDRMELKSIDFHSRVRSGFLEIAESNPERFFVIDEMTIEEGREVLKRKLNEIIR